MKIIAHFLFIILSLGASNAFAQTVASLAVVDVQVGDGAPQEVTDYAKQVGDDLQRQLKATRKFDVFSDTDFAELLQDQSLSRDKVMARDLRIQDLADRITEVNELDYVFSIVLSSTPDTVTASLNILSTSWGLNDQQKTVVVNKEEGKDMPSSIVRALLTTSLSELFPIRIVDVDENGGVTLNYGDGLLMPKQLLQVYAPVQKPANGAVEAGPAIGAPLLKLEVTSASRQFAEAVVKSLDVADAVAEPGLKARLID